MDVGVYCSYEEWLPKRDATPEDYDNEDLYMEMGKIYYAVCCQCANANSGIVSLTHTSFMQANADRHTDTDTHTCIRTHIQTHNTQDVDKANILAPYEVDRSAINIVADLGQGQFGQVSKAKMKNILPGKSESFVAVKMLKRMCFKRSNHYM